MFGVYLPDNTSVEFLCLFTRDPLTAIPDSPVASFAVIESELPPVAFALNNLCGTTRREFHRYIVASFRSRVKCQSVDNSVGVVQYSHEVFKGVLAGFFVGVPRVTNLPMGISVGTKKRVDFVTSPFTEVSVHFVT